MNGIYNDNRRGRTLQLLGLAWGLYAVSFFLPTYSFGAGPDRTRSGRDAFLLFFDARMGENEPLVGYATVALYEICNICTLFSPVIFWMGRPRWDRGLSLVLGTALVLGTVSFVLAISADHGLDYIYAGYYTWLGSMTYLAAVLFGYGRMSTARVNLETPGRSQ